MKVRPNGNIGNKKSPGVLAVILLGLITTSSVFAGERTLCYLSESSDADEGCSFTVSSHRDGRRDGYDDIKDFSYNCQFGTDEQAYQEAIQAYQAKVAEAELSDKNAQEIYIKECMHPAGSPDQYGYEECSELATAGVHSSVPYGKGPDSSQFQVITSVDRHDRSVKYAQAKAQANELVKSGYCAAVVDETK